MSDQPTSDTKTDQQPKIVTNSKTGEKFRVETIKTKTKRKEHPKDHLYQNRPGYEYGKALREKLLDLDPSTDMDALSEEKLVQDHEAVKAFVQTVKTGDIIGVKHSRFKVVGTTEDGIYVDGTRDALEHTIQEDSMPPYLDAGKLDFARWLGHLDILWRDEKPYGVSEYEDYTVNILHPVDENGKDIEPPTPASQPNVAPAKQSIPKKQNRKGKGSK